MITRVQILSRSLLVGVVLSHVAQVSAIAQGAPNTSARAAARAPTPIEPVTAMSEIRAAYAKGPTSERISMTLRSAERTTKGEGVIVTRLWQRPTEPKPALAPGGEGEPAPSDERVVPVVERVLAVEIGPLRAVAREGELRVVHTQHDGTIYEREFARPLRASSVRTLMPPLALPALAILANADDDAEVDRGAMRGVDLTPWTTNVRWTGATIDPQSDRPEMVLRGRGDQGEVTLLADGTTGRLSRLTAGLAGGGTLEMTFEPLPSGDPATWNIERGSRRRVDSLADLISAEPALKVGDTLGFIDAAQVFGTGPTDAASAVILMLSDPNPGQRTLSDHDAIALAAVQAIAGVIQEPSAKTVPARAIIVARRRPEADDVSLMRAALAVRWPSVEESALLNPPPALGEAGASPPAYSVALIGPTRSTIQRLSRDANVVLCIVDRQMRLLAIIEVDGRTDDVPAISRELRDAARRTEASPASNPLAPSAPPLAPPPAPAVPAPAAPPEKK